ncbi:MAG: ABC transporter ATP-binding protein/permease [Marmoricola sp.]
MNRAPLRWLGALLALYLLVPLAAFVWRLGTSHERGFHQPGLWSALGTSVLSASISTLIVAVLGLPLALWLARSRGWLRRVVNVLVQLPLVLPPVMSGIVLIYVVGPYTWLGKLFNGNLTDSLAGLVIAQTFVASPFLIIAARSAFASVNPHIDELAATLGHGPLARFWRVDLRLASAGITAGLLLTWLRAIGEFGATVLLAYHPYSLPVFTYVQFSSAGIPTTQAPTALALALAILVLLASQLRRPARWKASSRLPAARPPVHPQQTLVSFDLDVHAGAFRLKIAHQATTPRIAILGPSGAGKSMTLRAIAGLLGPSAGEVHFGSEDMGGVAVEHRNLGYIPQDHGLLPDRTAWQNVLFATRADPQLAAWWMQNLRISELANQRPGELSGGQRQRVSIAQALSHEPRVVLLDEPFSALDAPIRGELRTLVRRLQREAGLSTVLVTHDAEEAATLADEVIVIDEGRVLQAGPTSEVFRRPASAAVARLLGVPNINHAVSGGPEAIVVDGVRFATAAHEVAEGAPVVWSIRPEHVSLAEVEEARSAVTKPELTATIVDVVDLGSSLLATIAINDIELQVRTSARDLRPATECAVSMPASAISVWSE